MSFWEEIQKQYQNAENRYRENLNTGINLMTNKANMMQQIFSNQMQSLGTQANMLGQSLQLPAQFTQMLANIDESARDRAMRESQWKDDYQEKVRSNKIQEKISQTQANNDSKKLSLVIDEYKRNMEKENADIAKANNIAENYLSKITNPEILNKISQLRDQGFSSSAIINLIGLGD